MEFTEEKKTDVKKKSIKVRNSLLLCLISCHVYKTLWAKLRLSLCHEHV